MNNKKKLSFLSLALALGMILGACNKPAASSQTPASSNVGPAESSLPSGNSSEQSAAPVSSSSAKPSSSAQPSSSSAKPSSSATVATLVSIAVKAPTKVAYTTADTALDLAGMVVTATYSDQSTKAITEGYTVSTVDFSTTGEKTVTVTYQGKTATFKVTVANQKFTVKFVVDGKEVQSGQVEKGQKASYTGDEPTKAADASAAKYRFKGWDKDLDQAITADTTFTAQFAAYAAEQMVDDFESYTSNGDMADAGWKALGYQNDTQTWTDNTKAAVSLGTKSVEGNKALRFDAWENGVGYKFAKDFTALPKSANALKFRLQVPSINTVKVILKGKVTIAGQEQVPTFTYTLAPKSSEYVEYVIPVAADGWALWGEAGKSIKAVSGWTGIHEDDFVNYMTGIEFYVQGNDGIGGQPYLAFLDSVRFVTLDNPALNETETMGQYTRYTGVLNNGYIVKVELGANGAATATILDAPQQQVIPGTVAIDADKNMTFKSADNGATLVYKAALKNGGQSLKYVEATGALAEAVTNVDLNAVQVVDNYEQYETDGQAYYQSKPADQRSGCRGAYFSEYYAGGSASSPWGGNGWSLLGGDGSQLKLKQDQAGAHSGKNYLCLKHSKSVAFRYMQWGLFDGSAEQNAFRGSKLSFWAKTNGFVKSFKVSMYSQTKPTLSTKDNYVKVQTFEQTEAIGQWKHFELNLNPALTYYGFMIFTEKNTSLSANEAYLYIDDVEVYTANPYAKYVAPAPAETLKANQNYIGKINGLLNAQISVVDDDDLILMIPGMSQNISCKYVVNDNDVEITIGETKYVGTLANKKITFKSVTGTDLVAQALNGVDFNLFVAAEDAESYENSGTMYYQGNTDESAISGARGAYYCDYYNGNNANSSPIGGKGWSLMGGDGNQLSLDSETKIEGKNSLKLRYSSAGNMRYLQWGLYKGTNEGFKGMSSFKIFLKNPTDNAVKTKLMVYKTKQVTNSTQSADYRAQIDITLPANSEWTPYALELDPNTTYYGFGILFTSDWKTSGYVYADFAYYTNVDNDPNLYTYAKPGMTLSATTNAGAASIKFAEGGKVYLTCAAANYDNVEGTYTLVNKYSYEEMVIKLGDNTLTGKYAVDAMSNFKVTLTVTGTTGAFAQLVANDTVFSNQ